MLYLCLERIVPGGAAATHVGEIVDGLRRRSVPVRLVAAEGAVRDRGLRRLARFAGVLARAAFALRRAEIVYVRSHFLAWPIARLARRLGRPVVHEINGTHRDALVTHPAFRPLARLFGALQRNQYRAAAALVAVTPGLAEWARGEAGHGRVHVVGNAANTALFRPDGPAAERAQPYLLFFGGLTRWHGVDAMLAAARHPDWPAGTDLVVAGPLVDGSLEAELAAAPPHVRRLGPVPQAELPPLIRGALATLVPISDPAGRSATGVLPLKLFEGLACGVPAVVTDLPGQREIVRGGGCGHVVPVDDGASLARAAASLASDPAEARRMGGRGAQLVAERHSWDAAAGRTLAILEEALRASR